MPFRAVAAAALDDWRRAEREMSRLQPDSPEWHRAAAEAEAARNRYQQAIEDARAAHSPEPPPFDTARAEPIAPADPPQPR
jgi:hypothetical protein